MIEKVLITGISGFCATHLARYLSSQRKLVLFGLDINNSSPEGTPIDEYISADICDYKQISRIIQRIKPDKIFHLAGRFSGSPVEIYNVNFLGGVNLLESIKEFAPKSRVLLVGSAAEYGYVPAENMPIKEDFRCNPIDPYGLSKFALTLGGLNYTRANSLKVCVARPFNIIGAGIPPTLVIGAILQRARKALKDGSYVIKIGNLDTKRDFIAVEEVVEGYIQLINAEQWGEIFNICSGQSRSIRSVVEILLSNSRKPFKLEVDSTLVRTSDVKTVFGSFEKARLSFDFNPKTTIQESLTAAWNFEIGGLNT